MNIYGPFKQKQPFMPPAVLEQSNINPSNVIDVTANATNATKVPFTKQLGANLKKGGPLLNKIGIAASLGGSAIDLGQMQTGERDIRSLIRDVQAEAYKNPHLYRDIDAQTLRDIRGLERGNRLTADNQGYMGDGIAGALQPGSIFPLLAAKFIPGLQPFIPLALANTLKQGTAGARQGQQDEAGSIENLYHRLRQQNIESKQGQIPRIPSGYYF